MDIIISVNIFVFLIVCFIGVLIGLDPKKWSSWLYGLYGFITGSSIGFLREGASLDLQVGAGLAFAVMAGGIMIHWTKQRYTKEYVQSVRENFDKLHAAAKKRREE
jgi:hypothetical protein